MICEYNDRVLLKTSVRTQLLYYLVFKYSYTIQFTDSHTNFRAEKNSYIKLLFTINDTNINTK